MFKEILIKVLIATYHVIVGLFIGLILQVDKEHDNVIKDSKGKLIQVILFSYCWPIVIVYLIINDALNKLLGVKE